MITESVALLKGKQQAPDGLFAKERRSAILEETTIEITNGLKARLLD